MISPLHSGATMPLPGGEGLPLAPRSMEGVASSALRRAEQLGRTDNSEEAARTAVDKKSHEAALQFEAILVRELLAPLEKSLSKGMGEQGASPMVGGMIVNGLGQSIIDGGGLGLAAVIEESMRESTVESVSATDGQNSRQGSVTPPKGKPGI